ncbi:MAG: EpsG family protein [Clostridia bacterium]|nr:EpsG family protein [Clostridia bacterium]
MAVYLFLLFVPIFIQHIRLGDNFAEYRKRNASALTMFFLFLTVLIMLRHETVGKDTANYISFFGKFARMEWGSIADYGLEPGFSYFNKIITLFTSNPQIYLALSALAVSAMIFPTYRRLCTDASLTIVLFCIMSTFQMMFSGIRQMLAVGIGFIAYELTRNKKLISFILCVLLAMTFHTSAFMLAFMYPLYHAKITKKWLLAVVPSLVVIFLLNRQIFGFLGTFIERYTKYDTAIQQTGAYTMLLLFAVFAVFAFLIPDESKLDSETIGLRNFLLLALVMQMFAPLHNLAMRMNYYYIIFIPLLLPKIIQYRSTRWTQVAVLGRHVMLVFFCAYFFLSISGGGSLHIVPYHFFWESV